MKTAISLLTDQFCDVILISSSLPDHATIQLSRMLRNQGTPVKVLVTDLIDSKALILTYLEEGAAGYILFRKLGITNRREAALLAKHFMALGIR